MTQEQELAMFEELMVNYVERHHEDSESFNPEAYEDLLENTEGWIVIIVSDNMISHNQRALR